MYLLSLVKPLKKYEDYVYRAFTYESVFLVKKSIEIMNTAVEQPFTKAERSSGLIYLGILYWKVKDYQKSSDCYHKGFELMQDENFEYRPAFKKAIEAFIQNEDNDRAELWLNDLLQRESYDKKFMKLNGLKTKVY